MPVGNAWERLVGGRVKELRAAKGWTQEELARRMTAAGYAMHQTTITKLEGGNRPTTIGEISAVAAIFNIPIAALFETYEAQDYADLAALANQLAGLATERVKLTERLNAVDAEYASLQTQYDDLQERVERDEEEARRDAAQERDWQAFMNDPVEQRDSMERIKKKRGK